ncbi:MAG TPA: c-type cytochrome, partial [Anaerolineales bacterium]
MHKFTGIILLIFLAIALSACSFSMVSDITPPPGSEQQSLQLSTQSAKVNSVYPIVPPDLADGEKIYTQECAECHGEQGLGDGPQVAQLSVPAATLGLSDLASLYSPADWYTIVTQGNMEKFMPAFSNLSDRQRWDVVAYAMSLSVPDEQVAQGNLLYQENCITCHGPTGVGNGSGAGELTTLPTDFTQQSFMARKSATSLYQAISTGLSPDMPAFADKLTEDERWALVSYLRTLTYASQLASLGAYPAPALTPISSPSPDAYPAPAGYPAPILSQTTLISPTGEISPTATFTGSVAIQLINGSSGSAPSDVPVTLYGFDDMQNTYSTTLTTGANGLYTFSNISMPEGRVFMAGANYASEVYGSDIVTVNSATPELNLQITVYDTTTDISALTADRLHILFDFSQPDVAQVIEVFIISNPSKQAVVSANQDHTVVSFPLPAGYSNLQFQD